MSDVELVSPETPLVLERVLLRAQRLGFLGAGPVEAHVEHALGYVEHLPVGAQRFVDLGSGGGIPALPLMLALPGTQWWLVESSERRADVLRLAVQELGVADRAVVVAERAERVGRGPLRGTADVVVARSFAAPRVLAELAAPLVRSGGRVVVSDRRDEADRWSADWLDEFGLARVPASAGWCVLEARRVCPDRYPRRRIRV